MDTFLVYQQRLYFIGTDSTHGSELWVTDGSDAGTEIFLDACPGTCSSGFMLAGEMDDLLYFITRSEGALDILWRSDGTIAGTNQLFDLPTKNVTQVQPKTDDSEKPAVRRQACWEVEPMIRNLILILWHGALYFSAVDDTHGRELWRSDCTPAGTALLRDIQPGPRDGEPMNLSPCGARLCFFADDGEHGVEIWSTGGTAEDTVLLVDVNNTPANSYPGTFIRAGRWAYFEANDGDNGESLWRTDGLPGGVTERVIADTVFDMPGAPYYGVLNGVLYMRAYDAIHGHELWRIDDDEARILCDLVPGASDSSPVSFTTAGDRLFFLALSSRDRQSLCAVGNRRHGGWHASRAGASLRDIHCQ